MDYHLWRIPWKQEYLDIWKSIELEHQDQDSNLRSNSKAIKVFDSIFIIIYG